MCCTIRPLLCGLLFLAGPAGIGWTTEVEQSIFEKSERTAIIQVGGMSSPLCQTAIETTLALLPGVGQFSVDREHGEVRASYDPDRTSAGRIASVIESLGFTATPAGGSDLSAEPESVSPLTCELSECLTRLATVTGLSPERTSGLVEFVADFLMESETIPTGNQIREATGVALAPEAVPALQRAVMAHLLAKPAGRQFAATSRCTAYSACSVTRNLINASGEELEMYEVEKKEDGRLFDGFALPQFEAHDLAGNAVRSVELNGGPALLVLLALHCHHSIDSLPILAELQAAFPNVRIVGVIVNSGTASDVNYVLPSYWSGYKRQFELWVYENPALGDLVSSHLVPTFMLIDEKGDIRQKLVGQKTRDQIAEALQSLASAEAR